MKTYTLIEVNFNENGAPKKNYIIEHIDYKNAVDWLQDLGFIFWYEGPPSLEIGEWGSATANIFEFDEEWIHTKKHFENILNEKRGLTTPGE